MLNNSDLMLNIKLFRDNPKLIKNNYKKRKNPELLKKVDEVVRKDKQWRTSLKKLDQLNHKRNIVSREVPKLKGREKQKKIKEMHKTNEEINKSEKEVDKLKDEVKKLLMKLPNLIHESVPYGKDDEDNIQIKKWGRIKKGYKPKSHVDILEEYDLGDTEKASKVSGARFYYLKGDLVLLDYALQAFALDFLVKKSFMPVEPPLMMRREPYEGVTDLADFKDMMYKIEDEDLYLIATSEHPIAAMHMNEVINRKKLPLKYAGISPCFRKEAGAHGKDTKGIFRTHQFNKVEQFVFCKPENGWRIFENLLKNAEEILQTLEIPYRIVNICTGDLGIVAAKKYDLEAWFPVQGKYREIVSCSNCTDYQARRLNIKYLNEKGKKECIHTINSTAIATGRTIVAIIENFQNHDGTISIPKALWKYIGKKKIKPKN